MENSIIINFDPFAAESTVWTIRDNVKTYGTVSSNLAELSAQIVQLSYGADIYNIKIHAPTAVGIEIARVIKEDEICKYNDAKIMIEVI